MKQVDDVKAEEGGWTARDTRMHEEGSAFCLQPFVEGLITAEQKEEENNAYYSWRKYPRVMYC